MRKYSFIFQSKDWTINQIFYDWRLLWQGARKFVYDVLFLFRALKHFENLERFNSGTGSGDTLGIILDFHFVAHSIIQWWVSQFAPLLLE
jgi:hypothetical protein